MIHMYFDLILLDLEIDALLHDKLSLLKNLVCFFLLREGSNKSEPDKEANKIEDTEKTEESGEEKENETEGRFFCVC